MNYNTAYGSYNEYKVYGIYPSGTKTCIIYTERLETAKEWAIKTLEDSTYVTVEIEKLRRNLT